MRMLRERIKTLFGEDAEILVRPGVPNVLWVRLTAGNRAYWVAFPRNRIERDNTDVLLAWMLAGMAIAILATALIAWRLNRPLAELARAAEDLGKGGDPPAVPETGPSEVRAVAKAFNRMKESLKREERERATFLAGISHDLRTPLARLRLDAEMLEEKVDAATQKGMIADIEDMNAIIDQFIDYARSEATEAFAPVNLSMLAKDCAERAARTGAPIRCELADTPVLMVRPLAAQRLVDNLIQNAIKHGGGEVLVRTSVAAREVSLAVLDRGPGIPEADIARVKEPFARLDEARSGRSGAGLGLAIVARIAKAHGARFDLVPRDGGGLAATVAFPSAA
jgi:two-component system osmolarity sensor histidine kinase EnvZ